MQRAVSPGFGELLALLDGVCDAAVSAVPQVLILQIPRGKYSELVSLMIGQTAECSLSPPVLSVIEKLSDNQYGHREDTPSCSRHLFMRGSSIGNAVSPHR